MNYFRYFPRRTNYEIILENSDKTAELSFRISFPDFFRQAAIIYPKISQNDFYFDKIKILDGERPDQLSNRLYNSINYWWTFFYVNEHMRLGENLQWPLSQYDLHAKVDQDFAGLTLIFYKDEFLQAGKNPFGDFIIGETVVGQTSGVSGTIVNLRPKFGQMHIQDIEHQYISYLEFTDGETIVGQTSGESMVCQQCLKTSEAIYKYVSVETGREVDNDNFIETDIYSTIPVGENIGAITYRENQEIINDRFSSIRVLRSTSVTKFVDAFRRLIKK
jgi:hypothetical protein